jgi:hypothetical protein
LSSPPILQPLRMGHRRNRSLPSSPLRRV